MRAMKDSGVAWIGEIPKEWDVRPIKNSFAVVSGATPKSDITDYWDGNVVWVTPADYKFEDKYVFSGKRNLTQAGYASCGTTLVPSGSIVFSKRAPIGTVAITGCSLCTNQGCLSCIPKPGVSALFFYYTMAVFSEQFNLYGTGTTFKEISFTDFSNFTLPLPSYEEQTLIAAFLDTECARIDAVIAQTRASIEEYKKLKQSVITQAVTKGIRPNRPMKDSGVEWLGEMPHDWKVSKIKYIAYFQPSCDTSWLTEESEITYTPMECIKNGYYINNTASFGNVAASLTPYNDGDIVIAKVTPCFENGNIAVMEGLASGFGLGSSELFVLRPHSIVTRYLFYWLRNSVFIQQGCATMTGTGGLKRVSPSFVKNCPIIYPDNNEQREIVDYLDKKTAEIDLLITKKEIYLSELETFKKSLIFEYVTGKREVTQ